MENLEELKKKFILDEDVEQSNIENLIGRISNFCRVDKNGYIFISDRNLLRQLNVKDKILLALSARYLASELQKKLGSEPTIAPHVSGEELSRFFSDKKEVIQARAKELKDEGKILVKERGEYSIYSFQIDDFIKSLETRGESKNGR